MNEETQSLISRVIENRGDNVLWHIVPNPFKLYEAPTWPGMLLKEGDEGFAALSGSPNVAGLCWLLIQHQGAEQLGKKTVKSIRVWKDDSGAYAPHILIEVGSVEWPHPKGPEGQPRSMRASTFLRGTSIEQCLRLWSTWSASAKGMSRAVHHRLRYFHVVLEYGQRPSVCRLAVNGGAVMIMIRLVFCGLLDTTTRYSIRSSGPRR